MQAPTDAALREQLSILIAFLVALSMFYEPISRLNQLNQISLLNANSNNRR